MYLALSLPGDFEWLLTLVPAAIMIVSPLLALVYYIKNRELKKQLEKVTRERDDLIA